MVRADLEKLFYAWLLHKFWRLCRYVWRLSHNPKARATLSWFFYCLRFFSYFMLIGLVCRFRLISDAQGEREWERLKRMLAELQRRHANYKAVVGSDDGALKLTPP